MKTQLFALFLALGVGACHNTQGASERECYPWGTRILMKDGTVQSLASWLDLKWHDCGGPEGHVTVVQDGDQPTKKILDWQVTIDHFNESQYPIGWPAFETVLPVPANLHGGRRLQFKMRALTDIGRPQFIRFIVRHGRGSNLVNTVLPGVIPGEWQTVTLDLGNAEWLKNVDIVHFFLCEDMFKHGEKLHFQFTDFAWGDTIMVAQRLPHGEAGATLWAGERADTDSSAVFLPQGTTELPTILHVENRLEAPIPASATVDFRITDVFTGKRVNRTRTLGTDIPADSRKRLSLSVPIDDLSGGYYHILADIRDQGKSLLDIRKGSDDFYLTRPGESRTYSILSWRAGLTNWLIDPLYGGTMHSTNQSLPHVYDPFDTVPRHYAQFLKLFGRHSLKHTEGYEACVPGLVIAAEAFEKAGDDVRRRYMERIIDNVVEELFRMQDTDCGGVTTMLNELSDNGLGLGAPSMSKGNYDNNQIGEWMRALNYIALYYRRFPERASLVAKMNRQCVQAGNYIVRNSLEDMDGIPGVLRHFRLSQKEDGTVQRNLYSQEGRQCDVYLPRALAGLGYTAYTLQLCGQDVPDAWWPVFDSTTRWIGRKLKPNGWFDWQCGDVVEGGCHTFLGNIYAGEGLFGVFLADREAHRDAEAEQARMTALKAYHYLTDDCYIHGRRYNPPTEFWVGPYVYWLFREWRNAIGSEPVFEEWLATLDSQWRVKREWKDFLRLPNYTCGRSNYLGTLETAILAYLGFRQMDETNASWGWMKAK